MREGGPADDSDAGAPNEWTVKSYKKKGSQVETLANRHGMASVTKGDHLNRMLGQYGKKAPKRGLFG
jgi:hypothetical protein